MTKAVKFIFFLIVVSSLLNCERKISNLEIENKIMDELFISMVDSIHRDNRIYLSFPPVPKPIYDEKHQIIKIDSTEYKRELVIFNSEQEKIKKDTSKLIICVSKKMYRLEDYQLVPVHEYFEAVGVKIDTTNTSDNKININEFTNNPKFKFTYSLNETVKRDSNGNIESYSEVSFSKIIFDKTKNTAALIGSYHCGGKCGIGYLIILTKKSFKWEIKEIKNVWIS